MIEFGEIVQFHAVNAVYTQHIDSTYDSVNFDDPISTLSYYKRLRRVAHQNNFEGSSEQLDQRFDNIILILTEKGSKISAETQAHSIMRSAAEKIHNAFRTLNRNSHADIVVFMMSTIMVSDYRLIFLATDCLRDEME